MPKELERTFLLKTIPKDLTKVRSKEIIDIYVPKSRSHPTLRIRKNGETMEMTKKDPIDDDAAKQFEHTISLDEEEFTALQVDGKKLHKIRYYYEHEGKIIEIGLFKGALEGLVLADVEFSSEAEMNHFDMPDFCLAEVTQEVWAAGGMLCGKSYEDIAPHLERFGYKKLHVK